MQGGRLSWLDGSSVADRQRWYLAWRATAASRPHYHPAYVIGTAPADRRPVAVYYEGRNGASILYPFWLGQVADLPFCPDSLKGAHDVVSPYGYGGPSYNGPASERQNAEEEFRQLFAAVCLERQIVAEFVRQDVHPDHLVADDGQVVYQQDNVVVRLEPSEEIRLGQYHHKVRKNVRRAREAGLKVIFDEQGCYLDQFLEVYYATMRRRGASSYFLFSRPIFETLIAELTPTRSLIFVHVLHEDRVVSTELLLCSRNRLYSFLGGTLEDSLTKRPNDLLKHAAIIWGAQHGFVEYVLGGGARPGDGIFQYKRAFEPQGTVPFFTRRTIRDQTAYEQLVAMRNARPGANPDPMFFPSYRA